MLPKILKLLFKAPTPNPVIAPAKALGAEFNSLQGSEPNIGIGSSINDHYLLGDPFYERTFAIDDGCDTLYYPRAKKRVTQEYADKFYGSVPEESVTIGVKMAE